MSDYRFEYKIKNNILYSKIMNRYKTVQDFAKDNNLSAQIIYQYLSFKINPVIPKRDVDGDFFRKTFIKIAKALGEKPENLITSQMLLIDADKTSGSRELEEEELLQLIDDPKTPDQLLLENQRTQAIEVAMAVLPEREQKIIKERFYEGRTIKAIAADLNLSRNRVTDLYYRGLRMLRHPNRLLKTFCEGEICEQ